jgi:hypothetical protein
MGTVAAPLDPKGSHVLSRYAGVLGADGRQAVLGRGTFGTVYKAIMIDKPKGPMYAVKVMRKPWLEFSDVEQKLLRSEIRTLFKCKHTHIIGARLFSCPAPCSSSASGPAH